MDVDGQSTFRIQVTWWMKIRKLWKCTSINPNYINNIKYIQIHVEFCDINGAGDGSIRPAHSWNGHREGFGGQKLKEFTRFTTRFNQHAWSSIFIPFWGMESRDWLKPHILSMKRFHILGLPTATHTQAMKVLLTMESFCLKRSFRSHQFDSRESLLPGRRVGAAHSRGVVFADALVSWRWEDQQEL